MTFSSQNGKDQQKVQVRDIQARLGDKEGSQDGCRLGGHMICTHLVYALVYTFQIFMLYKNCILSDVFMSPALEVICTCQF